MGKSTAAQALRRMGIPVHDADREVHRLLSRGGDGVAAVERGFPGVTREGAVDRQALGRKVFADHDATGAETGQLGRILANKRTARPLHGHAQLHSSGIVTGLCQAAAHPSRGAADCNPSQPALLIAI